MGDDFRRALRPYQEVIPSIGGSMKKLALMVLGLSAALPLHAQDSGTTPPPDASSSSTPPADNSQLPAGNASGGAPASDTSATPPPADNSAAAAPATTEPAPATTEAAAPAPAESAPATTEAAPATTTEAAPATTEAAPASTEAAAAAPTEAAPAAAEAAPSGTESTPTVEATPTESAPAEAAPSERKPWIFYAGADYGSVKVSFSDNNGGADFSNRIWQARVGMRLTDAIGLEGHFAKGLKDDDTPNQPMLDMAYGVYLVPTGTLLDIVEFGFPLGFSWTKLKAGDASTTEDGVSYGMNVEFPLKLVWDALPDIRIGGGGMVYQQNNNARTYGWHAGVRFDFAI